MLRTTARSVSVTLALLVLASVFAVPVAAQADANLTVDVSETTVTPGEEITVTYTLENVGDEDGSSTSISFERFPDSWTVTSASGDWQADQKTWISLQPLEANGTYKAKATVTVPENASEGEYELGGDGFVTPEISDSANATVTVRKPSSASNLTVTTSTTSPRPGGDVTLTYNLTNTGENAGNSTAVDIDDIPAGWTVTSASGDWQAGQNSWISLNTLDAGGSYDAKATVSVPENASEGNYTVNATGIVATGIDDTASVTLSVEEFNTESYDSDGDGSVKGDTNGVVKALADYNENRISFQEALMVIAAYNG